MTTRLDSFRDHCQRMAAAEHKPDCPTLTAKEPHWNAWLVEYDDPVGFPARMRWRGPKPKWEPPHCDGCNPDTDRALFAQLAREVADYQEAKP